MDKKDMIFNAFANGDLINVLRGSEKYSIRLNPWVSADVPTDWTQVLPMYYLFSEKIKAHCAKQMLEKAILDLLKSNAEDLYIGMSVLYLQILEEEHGQSPFKIDRKQLLQTAIVCIEENRDELRNTKRWMGKYESDGLLAEVKRYQKLLKSKFQIDMQPQNRSMSAHEKTDNYRRFIFIPTQGGKKVVAVARRIIMSKPTIRKDLQFRNKSSRVRADMGDNQSVIHTSTRCLQKDTVAAQGLHSLKSATVGTNRKRWKSQTGRGRSVKVLKK